MNKQTFEALIQEAVDRKIALRRDKGAEYTQGDEDVLANFKKGGIELGISPLKVWRIYYKKHDDAIVSFIKTGREISTEGIEGRIDDMQVYLDLLRGLVAEHKTLDAQSAQFTFAQNRLENAIGRAA